MRAEMQARRLEDGLGAFRPWMSDMLRTLDKGCPLDSYTIPLEWFVVGPCYDPRLLLCPPGLAK
jgi:hypothetical protein